MKKLRAAVVGCGALANGAHLPTIQASPMFDLVVTCDKIEAQAQAAKDRWGAKRMTTDWHEVVTAKDVDLIVLCTHTSLRADLICEAVRHGKPVYSEKPLADSQAEMFRILHAVHETGGKVCVGHNRRSSPSVLEFKRLVELARKQGADRGAIIDRNTGLRAPIQEESQMQLLLRVNDDIRTWKGWIFDDEYGIMLAEMVHFIDLALWLVAADPVQVYACGSPRGNFTQIISFRDGSIATLQHTMVGNFDYPKELFEATLRNVTIANEHHLEVRQRGLEKEPFCTIYPMDAGGKLTKKTGLPGFYEATEKLQEYRRRGEKLPMPYVGPCKGHRAHLERFGLHVMGKGENPCPVESAIVVTRVALKLVESARLGLPVKLNPEDYDLVRGDWAELHRPGL